MRRLPQKYDKDGVEITDVVIAIKQHSLTSVPAKESTCTVQGNIAYNHCSVCEKDFDDDGNELESVKLPLKEHTLGEWESDEDGHYKVCPSARANLKKKVILSARA